MSGKRVKVMEVMPDCFVELAKANPPGATRFERVIEHPLPADAKLVRVGVSSMGRMYLIIESAEFEEVPDHGQLPLLPETLFEVVRS